MRVLIVEDNAFNAFCLRRLIEQVILTVSVNVVQNSHDALAVISNHIPDLVVIDGDLGTTEGLNCNGPELANILLQKYPQLPLVSWSNSESMNESFMQVFRMHGKVYNECTIWTKLVSLESLVQTLNYYFADSHYLQMKNLMGVVPIRTNTYRHNEWN